MPLEPIEIEGQFWFLGKLHINKTERQIQSVIKLPVKLVRLLQTKGWKHKDRVFLLYDEAKDTLLIRKGKIKITFE